MSVVSDRDKNLLIYTYQPETRESQGGQRLLRRGDFNVGVHVNTFFRIRSRLSDPSVDKKSVEKKHATFYGECTECIMLCHLDFCFGHINKQKQFFCRYSLVGWERGLRVTDHGENVQEVTHVAECAQRAHTSYRGTQPQGLQVSINVHIPHTAGLNPKAYRSVSMCTYLCSCCAAVMIKDKFSFAFVFAQCKYNLMRVNFTIFQTSSH